MQYLWERDTLLSLLKHRLEEVQEWAAERLFRLYPETEDTLLALLPQAPPQLASLLLTRARGHINMAALHEFFLHATHAPLQARAAALLLRAGQTLPTARLADVDLSHVLHLLAETPAGFDVLRQRYQDTAATDEHLLRALAMAGGAAEIFSLLHDTRDKKAWRQTLDDLGSAWGCEVSDLHRVSRAPAALSILEHTLGTLSLPAMADTPWQQELLAALAQDRARLRAMAEVTSTRLTQRREATPSDVAFLVACVLAVRRDAHCQRLVCNVQEVGHLWQAVVMRPWQAEVGPALSHWVRQAGPDTAINALRAALRHDYIYADYAFQVLNAAGFPERFGLFIELSQDKESELVFEEAVKALHASGPAAADALVAHYRQHLPEPIDLLVLAEIPTLEVEEFLVTHFDHYMQQAQSKMFVEALEMVASRRFLQPLLAEWREGELAIGRAITLIAAVHDVQEPRLRTVARDVETRSKQFKNLPDRIGQEPVTALQDVMAESTPLILPLRCTACGKTYHYEARQVYINPKDSDDAVLWQIMQCKGCGSIETYEWTQETRLPLMAEMIRLMMWTQRQQGKSKKRVSPPDSPLVLQKPVVMAAQRHFQNMGEAYHFLQEALAKDPSNGDLHRRLGNLLKNGGRSDLALPYYRKAIVLDPNDAESSYNIVKILIEQQRYQEAVPLARTLVQLCREAPMDETLRREMFGAMLTQASTLEQHTKQRIEIFPTAATSGMLPSGAGQDQPTVYLTSFNLDDPHDFERVYQTFRTGHMPEDTPRRGVLRSLRETFTARDSATAVETPDLPMAPVRALHPKVGRNAPCPCGSGRKYKKCCGQ